MILKLLKDKFIKDSFVYVVGSVLGGLLGYVFHFVVSRKLSVSEYGELQSLLSLFSILGFFGSAITYFTVKYSSVFAKEKDYASNKQFLEWLESKIVKLSFLLLVLFFLISPLIFEALHLKSYLGLVFVGITLSLSVINMSYSGVLSGWQEFFSVSIVNVVNPLVKLISGFLIVLFFPKASLVLSAFLFASLNARIFYRILIKKKFIGRKSDDGGVVINWKEKYFSHMDISRSIAPILFFSLTIVLIQNIDILLVKNLTSSEITGYYGALSLLGKIVLWFNLAIVAVVLPNACASGNLGGKVSRKINFSAYGLILFASLSAILLYFFFPTLIISMLFGQKYALFANDLWLFGVLALFLSLLSLEANFAYARHNFRISYILAIVVIIMTGGIYFFHSSIREVALSVVFAVTVGYFGVLFFNLFGRKKKVLESALNICEPKIILN